MSKNKISVLDILFTSVLFLIIVFGCFLRTYAWFHGNPFFVDEGALFANISERNYLRLFLPLDTAQCCPPLFLIFSKFLYSFYGADKIILRLMPYLFSLISFILFVFLSFKIIRNKFGIICSSLVFAFSEWCILQQMYFKQYIGDAFFSVVVLMLILWLKDKKLSKNHLFFLSLLSVFLVFCSYTAGFLIACGVVIFSVKNTAENRKNNQPLFNFASFMCYIVPFAVFMSVYFILNCLPAVRNDDLQNFWDNIFYFIPKNFIQIKELIKFFVSPFGRVYPSLLLFVFSFVLLVKNDRFSCSVLYLPFFTAVLFGILKLYPLCPERVSLYLIPLFILIIFKPTDYISVKNKILSFFILLITLSDLNYSKIYSYTTDIISGNSAKIISKYTNRYKREKVTLSEELIEMLYHSDIKEDDYIVRDYTSAYFFDIYDYLKKFQLSHIVWDQYGNFDDLKNIPQNANVYFFISEEYHFDYKELKDWINNNCEIIYNIKCYNGEFIKCRKKTVSF